MLYAAVSESECLKIELTVIISERDQIKRSPTTTQKHLAVACIACWHMEKNH